MDNLYVFSTGFSIVGDGQFLQPLQRRLHNFVPPVVAFIMNAVFGTDTLYNGLYFAQMTVIDIRKKMMLNLQIQTIR